MIHFIGMFLTAICALLGISFAVEGATSRHGGPAFVGLIVATLAGCAAATFLWGL